VTEVKEFRKKIGDWLAGISGVAAEVGDRIYFGWPMQPPTFPLITYTMGRRPEGDYPGHVWACSVHIDIHAVTASDADAIEDAIYQELQSDPGDATDVIDDLSGDGVTCHLFALSEVAEDAPSFSLEDGAYRFLTRRMSFDARISHATE